MKRLAMLVLIFVWILAGYPAARAQAAPDGTLNAHMAIMDDYGNILSHYTLETFQIEDDKFFYREAPKIPGYVFMTANILELDNGKDISYRVNYFYSAEETESQPLPDPMPISEMPRKTAPLVEKKAWFSWTDGSMRELRASKEVTLDYYWDAFEIPRPARISGYGYSGLITGSHISGGEKIPHFVFIYKNGAEDQSAPSLLFGHLLEDRRIAVVPEDSQETPDQYPAEGFGSSTGSSIVEDGGTSPETSRDLPNTEEGSSSSGVSASGLSPDPDDPGQTGMSEETPEIPGTFLLSVVILGTILLILFRTRRK